MPRNSNTYDNLLLLKDAGAVSANGAATVAGQLRVIDLGPAWSGSVKAVIDTAAISTGNGNETYRVAIQGSNDITFATGVVELGSVNVVASEPRNEAAFSDKQGDTIYRYVRAFTTVGGTGPSINFTAFIAKD
jgi:hypothetical protein